MEESEEVMECLGALMLHSGASLLLDKPGSVPLPVVLKSADPEQGLLVDIGSIREVAADLMHGMPFRLLGQSGGKLQRSSPLTAGQCREEDDTMLCECPVPEYFEVFQQRDDYRASLGPGLECDVVVDGGMVEDFWVGKLRDLSMNGCLVEMSLGAATLLAHIEGPIRLELCFPDGTRFEIQALLRHLRSNIEKRYVHAGFEFLEPSAEQGRQLWFFVREIEREVARNGASEQDTAESSPLFREEWAGSAALRRKADEPPTPVARSLGHIAEFLDTQILALRTGEKIDETRLSRQAEQLLLLLEQSREALLFATVCLWREPPQVRHCLGVAVRLVDMVGSAVPRDIRKVMMASAMVHDLGKALLPAKLLRARGELDVVRHQQMQRHVELLLPRLEDCRWISPKIMLPVVEQANERLDGSGYPKGLGASRLHELARMMAVVDVVDAMGRRRADRRAHPIDSIYRHLQSRARQFDPRWVNHYMKHFGKFPVGTPLRFENGELGWVRELDAQGWPSLVQLATGEGPPKAGVLGELVWGDALAKLGGPIEILAWEFY